MENVWLREYPDGVPAEIGTRRYSCLNALFARSFMQYKHRPAFINMGTVLTYEDLERKSTCFAAFLQQHLELKKGDRLAIMIPNLLQYPVVLLGSLMAGVIVVNTNPLYTPRELKHQLNDSGAIAIVILENYAYVLAKVLRETPVRHVIVTGLGDLLHFPKSVIVNWTVKYLKRLVPAYRLSNTLSFLNALSMGRRCQLIQPQIEQDDIAFLQYTGGTTGVAKGAMLSHGNILANLQQALVWLTPPLEEGGEVIVTALPLYHIFSLLANALLFMEIGGLNCLITNPRDMKGFVKTLSKIQFTCITGVNTLYKNLMNTPGFPRLDFSGLKLALGGGMAIHPAVAQRWKSLTGNVMIEAYGLTEASPAVCINPRDVKEHTGSVGLPLPSTQCVVQDNKGHSMPVGKPGELCIRGPQVMQGYWNQPEETRRVLSTDGWLKTGDVATMDTRGYVHIVDRIKDLIVVSGFNVYPNEIESVIVEHPGVLEAGAIGVPDPKSGEVVKVFVVKKDAALTEELLRSYCREHMSGYKVPRYVEFRAELPKTNVGKVMRSALRQ